MIIRKAILRLQGYNFNSSLEELNKDCEGFEILAISRCKVTRHKTKGLILKHPAPLATTGDFLKGAAGSNKGVFVALKTDKGEVLYLIFKEEDLDKIIGSDNAEGLFKDNKLDKSVAAERGLAVMTADNTTVTRVETRGKEDAKRTTFVLTPYEPIHSKRRITYTVTLTPADEDEDAQAQQQETVAWLKTVEVSN